MWVDVWLDNDMAATTNPAARKGGKGSIMDFSSISHGCLTTGTVTSFGVIEQVSYTAYLINGTWVPFFRVHGPYAPVMPLVVLG